ncbi:MAG: phosphate ABC transporter substrate-binding protein PstS [Syntrophobacteraceae bacterium]
MRAIGAIGIMCMAMWFGASASVFASQITGAGASFPYPVFARWALSYRDKTGIKVNYRSIGSGGGISQLEANTIDFGASEMPLQPEALKKTGLVQFPAVIGGVIPVVNLRGVKPGEIKLSGKVLADIYLGKITKWNSPEIARLNEGVKLPDQYISVVHRSDSSGTTFTFTNYLSKISPDWKHGAGTGVSVSWPKGAGGKGNEGVASYVQNISGSIGYVEYAYALQNDMTYTLMENRDGFFVEPDAKSFQAAAAGYNWAGSKDFYVVFTDQPGKNAWPIIGVTFILMHKVSKDPLTAKRALNFFAWVYRSGGKLACELSYIPMPESAVKLIKQEWKSQIKGPDGKSI